MNRIVAAAFVAIAVAVCSRYGPRLVWQMAQQSQNSAPRAVRQTGALKQYNNGGNGLLPVVPTRRR